jgi:hypothetical protein
VTATPRGTSTSATTLRTRAAVAAANSGALVVSAANDGGHALPRHAHALS